MLGILEKVRNKVFWFIDSFQFSRSIKNQLDEIKNINENFNSEDVIQAKKNMLDDILNHAVTSTNYYRKYKNYKSLIDFPVVSKNIIRDDFDDFESKYFVNKKRYKVATSGSTGIPFVSYFNKNKRIRNSADTIYFASKTGFEIGHKLFYIRFWGEQYRKSKFASWKQNIIPYNVIGLKDKDINELINKIKSDPSTLGVVAYASALESICLYLDKIKSTPIKSNIQSIILISESLNEYTYNSVIKYFGIIPVSRYSNSENGILAQQTKENDEFIINWASYYFEILSLNKDIPVDFGEVGRIVITDLFNRAVPMIRYDTGDLGSMVNSDKGIVLNKLEGRIMDVLYDASGELISPHIVQQICVFEGIIEYQLIQTNKKKYKFKIVANEGFKEEKLIKSYKKLLGSDAEIDIVYVNEIPLLKSGKRKKVVNLYKE